MPSLTFVMPHWLYWCGLALLSADRRRISSRAQRKNPPDSRALAVHRLSVLAARGIPRHPSLLPPQRVGPSCSFRSFIAIIYCTSQVREVRDDMSRTFAAMEQAQTAVAQREGRTGRGVPDAAGVRWRAPRRRSRRATAEYDVAKAVSDDWKSRARTAGIVLGLMLLVDAVLLPGAVRRRRALETRAQPDRDVVHPDAPSMHEGGVGEDPTLAVHSRFTDAIDALSTQAGQYVAWWAVIAVFVYYYEVIARFVFNSPTNWVHESMFLMFGMQYMLCGAFAYREDQHVRVDVIYAKFSPRGKAIADIITSVFFFIFIGNDVLDRRALRDGRDPGRRAFVHRMGHPVLAGEARDPGRRRAAAAAGHLQAAEGHHDRHAQGEPDHGPRDRHRLAQRAAVRIARPAADARPADGVLHRQPRRHLPVRVRQRRDPQHAAVARIPVHDGLPALRGAAVHLHGGGAGESGDHRGALRRHLQMAGRAQGRPRVRDGARLHGARRDGRRRRRDRGHDGHDRAARDAEARLRAQARLRLAARRRHARHPDPAFGDGDRLRGRRAAVAGRAADRLGIPRTAAVGTLHRVRDAALLHQSGAGARAAGRGARELSREAAAAAQHDHAGSRDPAGAGHHLLRHRHAGRGRRHRHLRRARRVARCTGGSTGPTSTTPRSRR